MIRICAGKRNLFSNQPYFDPPAYRWVDVISFLQTIKAGDMFLQSADVYHLISGLPKCIVLALNSLDLLFTQYFTSLSFIQFFYKLNNPTVFGNCVYLFSAYIFHLHFLFLYGKLPITMVSTYLKTVFKFVTTTKSLFYYMRVMCTKTQLV